MSAPLVRGDDDDNNYFELEGAAAAHEEDEDYCCELLSLGGSTRSTPPARTPVRGGSRSLSQRLMDLFFRPPAAPAAEPPAALAELRHFGTVIEGVPGRLYLLALASPAALGAVSQLPQEQPPLVLFSVDNVLQYEPFHLDFGPLNLACVHRYCVLARQYMRQGVAVHYCSADPKKRANSVFLLGAYLVAVARLSPAQIDAWLAQIAVPLVPYRDATYGTCTFKLLTADCLRGLHRAVCLGWYDPEKFDLLSYETCDRLENGDLHWVIPGEFIAFSGPEEPAGALAASYYALLRPREYAELFRRMGVKLVIRLNKEQYDASVFTRMGIAHRHLYFLDGSCPPPEILNEFMHLAEHHPKPIAVHCKAGLGRTGTLLGCYAMKRYGFTAREWLGWNRIVRPGSVLGPQQTYLCEMENELRARREAQSPLLMGTPPPLLLDVVSSKLSNQDRFKMHHGDLGQGRRLLGARAAAQTPVKSGSTNAAAAAASSTATAAKPAMTPAD